MAEFFRGTTPILTIQLSNGVKYADLGETLFFRFKQGSVIIDVNPTINGAGIAVLKLTQEDTLKFKPGKVMVQLMGVEGPEAQETVVKSKIGEVTVEDSIITTAIHNQ